MSNYSNNQNSYKKIDGNFDGKKIIICQKTTFQ